MTIETISQSEYEALSDEEKLSYELVSEEDIAEVSDLTKAKFYVGTGKRFSAVNWGPKHADKEKDLAKETRSRAFAHKVFAPVAKKEGESDLGTAADKVLAKHGTSFQKEVGKMSSPDQAAAKAHRKAAAEHEASARSKAKLREDNQSDLDSKKETGSMTTKPEHDDEVPVTESAASDTLVAARNVDNDPKTKIEAIASMIGAMHAMKKDDCLSWFNQTMAQFGKFGDGAPDASSSNRSSINMKGTVREEVADLFAGDELSEEFKEKAQTIFEAALQAEVITRMELAEEEMQAEFEQKLDEAVEGLAEQMNSYLDYAVGQWIKDNEVAIERSLRSEIAEDILAGIKQVFVENNVEIDEDQVDVVEALAAEVDELKEGMNALIEERQALQAQLVEAAREKAVGEVSEGMTISDAEKFRVLAEEVEAPDLDAFRRKIEVIREAMFKAPTSKEDAATVLTESIEPESTDNKFVGAAPEVLAYAKAISRTTRR